MKDEIEMSMAPDLLQCQYDFQKSDIQDTIFDVIFIIINSKVIKKKGKICKLKRTKESKSKYALEPRLSLAGAHIQLFCGGVYPSWADFRYIFVLGQNWGVKNKNAIRMLFLFPLLTFSLAKWYFLS